MSELKYLYACLKDGTVVSISDADKSQEYYLYPGEKVKLILRHGEVYQKHFAVKSEDLLINGNRVRFNSINESPEHYNFKMNILKEGYFYYKEYKLLIKNAKVELRISNSLYRADVFGELLCGTPCIIEVIKTCKVSEEKKEFINENQILTFEIIIDKDGNQIIEQSNCYGNAELERLTSEIVNYKDEITRADYKFRWKAKDLYMGHENEIRSIDNRVETAIRNAGGSIENIRRRAEEVREELREKYINRKSKIFQQSDENFETFNSEASKILSEIEEQRALFAEIEYYARKIRELEGEIKIQSELESEVRKISEDCQPEWFGYFPKGVPKLNHIFYFIS
jgi:Sec-independent protein translocase protein TatA